MPYIRAPCESQTSSYQMKVYKEVWKDGKLVVGEQTDAPAATLPVQVQKLLDANGITPERLRPKLYNRPDARCTDLGKG
jgi:hypothetical protein